MSFVVLVLVVGLAVLAGAVIGTYLAWQPTLGSAQEAIEQAKTQVEQAISSTEKNIAQATEHLSRLEIVVPEPKVSINFQWWHVFFMTLAVVLGMTLSRAYDRSAMRKVVSSSMSKMMKRIHKSRKRRA